KMKHLCPKWSANQLDIEMCLSVVSVTSRRASRFLPRVAMPLVMHSPRPCNIATSRGTALSCIFRVLPPGHRVQHQLQHNRLLSQLQAPIITSAHTLKAVPINSVSLVPPTTVAMQIRPLLAHTPSTRYFVAEQWAR